MNNEFLQQQLALRAEIKDGNKTWEDLNNFRIANGLKSVHVDTLSKGDFLLKDYVEFGWVNPIEEIKDYNPLDYKATLEFKNGNFCSDRVLYIADKDLRDSSALLRLHDFDPKQFKLISARNSMWNCHTASQETKVLYSSRVTVAPLANELSFEDVSEHFKEYFKEHKSKPIIPQQYEYGSECLVPCFFDVHFGKLADINETGEKYDYKIAKERVLSSVLKYKNKLQGRKFEKIIFAIGNDYFNSESTGSTFNGTVQDNDSRYSKIFKKGTETLIEAIDILETIAPVEVILVQGNHDFATSFYCSCVLEAYYKDSKNVVVNSQPTLRKYIKFGTTLLGFTHGSEEKDRIYGLMQHEASEDWGNTTTREWLIGHLHTESVTEKNGVIVRRIPSLTGSDQWHYKSGYVTSKKRTMAFIYDKEEGLVETHYVNI